MPKHVATDSDVDAVAQFLVARGATHLRVRKRAELVVIESGPPDDPIPHARLRRDALHLWRLEFATHTGKWEKTGFRGSCQQMLELITDEFPWTIAPIALSPSRDELRKRGTSALCLLVLEGRVFPAN